MNWAVSRKIITFCHRIWCCSFNSGLQTGFTIYNIKPDYFSSPGWTGSRFFTKPDALLKLFATQAGIRFHDVLYHKTRKTSFTIKNFDFNFCFKNQTKLIHQCIPSSFQDLYFCFLKGQYIETFDLQFFFLLIFRTCLG